MANLMKNKVALVTGGSSGIGRGAALKLAENGARVALLDLNAEDAMEVKHEIEDLGSKAIIIEADVSKTEDMEQAFKKVFEEWGQLDFVFSNAGINGVIAPIEDMSIDEFDATIHTNLRGTFLTVKNAIPYMKENGGSIVITSSVNGNRTFNKFGFSAYSTSKAGQVAFGKMAALELARYKIRVNMICPGAIDTNIDSNTFPENENLKKITIPIEYPEGEHPLTGEAGKPDQVGDLVLFLASNLSSHITGTKVYIDGAESLL